jgi:hypothetical protein
VLLVPVHRVVEQRDRGPVLVEAIDEQVERHAGVGVTSAFGLAIGSALAISLTSSAWSACTGSLSGRPASSALGTITRAGTNNLARDGIDTPSFW